MEVIVGCGVLVLVESMSYVLVFFELLGKVGGLEIVDMSFFLEWMIYKVVVFFWFVGIDRVGVVLCVFIIEVVVSGVIIFFILGNLVRVEIFGLDCFLI